MPALKVEGKNFGQVVDSGRNASVAAGKIPLQSKGAEIFFKTVELIPQRFRFLCGPAPTMRVTLEIAAPADADEIAALRNAAADDLTAKNGEGWWSGHCSAKGVLFDQRHGKVYVFRRHGTLVATLTLTPKKPWAIDRTLFSKVARPLYLINMAVAPGSQRNGVGRACLEDAADLARRGAVEAIFLDAYDHPAGAGGFYRKCGYREVGRAAYRKVPLIYFERLVSAPAG